ncbi:alpha beta-hydrolase [Gloeopeniophorella convolvens]|nr:alpha beta-hydrolase [Gloeopeniophorella convolvens]
MAVGETLAFVVVVLSSAYILFKSPGGPLSTTVVLDKGTFSGNVSGNSTSFLGIPYALPPIGDLRFRLPVPNAPYSGSFNVTRYGPSCVQQNGTAVIPEELLDPQALQSLAAGNIGPIVDSEDCLTINVIKPSSSPSDAALPVLVVRLPAPAIRSLLQNRFSSQRMQWIYGGGFEEGNTASHDGRIIVERSLAIGEPIIYVSMNYRVSALGFISSKEVQEAGVGNLGLQDQRQALRWVQKYIRAFGGDPSKVTIWGESAGAISVSLQMLANGGNTEGLFRAAFMESGAPPPVANYTHGQAVYDAFVASAGCSGVQDTLECLRQVPLSTIRAAQEASPYFFGYSSLNLAWNTHSDGNFIRDDPQKLVLQGSVANIPFISGNCDDEGTLFSLSSTNVTTDAEALDYIRETYLPNTAESDLAKLMSLYSSHAAMGSPFDTGNSNAISPQFKRLAAIQGDIIFQAPRRFFVQQRSSKQPTYAFVSKRFKSLPDLGAYHSTDLLNVYGPGDMTDYLVRFATTLNPNGNTGIDWPPYTNESPQLLTFLDGPVPLIITNDTHRVPQMELLTKLVLENPV